MRIITAAFLIFFISLGYANIKNKCSNKVEYSNKNSYDSIICNLDGIEFIYSPVLKQSYFYNDSYESVSVSSTYLGNTTAYRNIHYTVYPTDGRLQTFPSSTNYYIGYKGIYDENMMIANPNDKVILQDITFGMEDGSNWGCSANTQMMTNGNTRVLVSCDKTKADGTLLESVSNGKQVKKTH